MSYDKYRNWPLPTREGNIFPVYQGQDLERQVLQDLAATDPEDETGKLEILDSYAAYAKRDYRQRVAEALSFLAGRILEMLLKPNIPSYLPAVDCYARGRPADKGKV